MRTRSLAPVLICAFAACDTATTDQHGSELIATTIDGWRFREVAAFGGAMPDEGYLVNGAAKAVQAADGRVFVLNANDRRIAVYDSAGTWLGDVGAIGSGPGEFTSPIGIALTREHIYILDGGRFSLLQYRRNDLSFLRAFPLGLELGPPMMLNTDSLGRVYVGFQPMPGITDVTDVTVARFDLETASVQPLLRLPTAPRMAHERKSSTERRITFLAPPFSPKPVWTAAPSGGVLFGDGAEPKLEQIAIDGSRSTLIRDPNLPALPVTEEDRTAYLAQNNLDAGTVQFPATRPYFSSVLAGGDGSVWLQTSADRWTVYAADGQRRGEVVAAKGTRVVGLGDRAVYTVTHDSLGVETLRFFRIAKVE